MLAPPRGTGSSNGNIRASYIARYRAMRACGVSSSAKDQYFQCGSYISGTCEYLNGNTHTLYVSQYSEMSD